MEKRFMRTVGTPCVARLGPKALIARLTVMRLMMGKAGNVFFILHSSGNPRNLLKVQIWWISDDGIMALMMAVAAPSRHKRGDRPEGRILGDTSLCLTNAKKKNTKALPSARLK
jgi:hypothetical protein